MNGMQNLQPSVYKEKASHGDVLMPIRRYRCVAPYSYGGLPLHWHEEMEAAWIEDGSVRYDINFESFTVQKDDILLISPHAFHSARAFTGMSMVSDSLVFHLDLLGGQVPDACTLRYISPVQTGKFRFVPVVHPGQPGHEQLLACLKELLSGVEDANGSEALLPSPLKREGVQRTGEELYRKELLFRFFRLAYQYGYVIGNENTATGREHTEKLKEVLSHIQAHYTENLTIDELAGLCHFSRAHFMSFFHRYTGMTCVEYINRCRLFHAAQFLAETDRPVMEAAMENGFHNISYFNKKFRSQFGVTPKEYRTAVRRLPQIHPPSMVMI